MAVRAAPMVVYTCDRGLRYTWIANPSGMTAAEILGKRDDELLPADDVRELIDIKRRVVDRGRGEGKEIKLTLRGSDLVYDLTCEPLRDEAGRTVGAIVAAMDITDRALLFEQLRQSEARFSAVVNHSPAYIFAKDREGRYILANEALARLVGTDPGRFIGKTDADFFPAAVAAKFHDDDTQVLENAAGPDLQGIIRSPRRDRYLADGEVPPPGSRRQGLCGVRHRHRHLRPEWAEEEWRKFAFLADNSYDFIGICDLQLAPFLHQPRRHAARRAGQPRPVARLADHRVLLSRRPPVHHREILPPGATRGSRRGRDPLPEPADGRADLDALQRRADQERRGRADGPGDDQPRHHRANRGGRRPSATGPSSSASSPTSPPASTSRRTWGRCSKS